MRDSAQHGRMNGTGDETTARRGLYRGKIGKLAGGRGAKTADGLSSRSQLKAFYERPLSVQLETRGYTDRVPVQGRLLPPSVVGCLEPTLNGQ